MQSTQIGLFHVLYFIGICGGAWLGATLGYRFGIVPAVIGAIAGIVIGWFTARIPEWLATRAFLIGIQNSSNEQLRRIIDERHWNFRQSLALLQLASRGDDVTGCLPRIIGMLESKSSLERLYGWDALRLVFDKQAECLIGYNPRNSTEKCREQVAEYRVRCQVESN